MSWSNPVRHLSILRDNSKFRHNICEFGVTHHTIGKKKFKHDGRKTSRTPTPIQRFGIPKILSIWQYKIVSIYIYLYAPTEQNTNLFMVIMKKPMFFDESKQNICVCSFFWNLCFSHIPYAKHIEWILTCVFVQYVICSTHQHTRFLQTNQKGDLTLPEVAP